MSTQQEIISYKPDLNIYGKSCEIADNGYVSANNDIKYSSDKNSTKTRGLRLFASNSPSSTINLYLSVTKDIDKYLLEIKSSLTHNKYETDYFSAKTEEEMQDILKDNKVDLDFSSDKLEIYSYLKSINDDINEILDLYVKCIFGDNVDPYATDSIMEDYISKLQNLEANNEYEKVNYASLYYDTQVSYALSDFISVLNTACEDLNSTDVSSKNFDLDTATKDLLKKYFNKETDKLDSLSQSLLGCKEDLLTALKNFYLEKQDFLSYLDTFAKISSYPNGKTELTEIKSDCKNLMNRRFDNLVKAYMNYNLICGDVIMSTQNKVKYRSFFK